MAAFELKLLPPPEDFLPFASAKQRPARVGAKSDFYARNPTQSRRRRVASSPAESFDETRSVLRWGMLCAPCRACERQQSLRLSIELVIGVQLQSLLQRLPSFSPPSL
jgi:hypothetical protein